MDKAFIAGFLDEITKLAAAKPKPFLHKIPGRTTAALAMKAAPLAALASIPIGIGAMGLGKGLRDPSQKPMPWEERY